VRSTDLLAVEAKHHPSCLRSFCTSFANYEHGINRAKEPKYTEHDHMSAAHEKALVSVYRSTFNAMLSRRMTTYAIFLALAVY
jgi:hypothetical protein